MSPPGPWAAALAKFDFKPASGAALTRLAAVCYGLQRKPRRWYWPFRESDKSLRERCLAAARGIDVNVREGVKGEWRKLCEAMRGFFE